MNPILYELLWFFFIYAFVGWIIGTVAAAVREKKFVDVGLLYGPLCPAYGFGGVAYAIFLTELKEHLFFLFLGGAILCFLLTLLTGFVLERIFHRKWWDYSRKRFQFGGYVNLPYAVVWGVLAVVWVQILYPRLSKLIERIPMLTGTILTWVLTGLMVINALLSGLAIGRYTQRQDGTAQPTAIGSFLDEVYPDGLVEWVWPNMREAEKPNQAD